MSKTITEKDLDATLATAAATLQETDRLSEEANRKRQETAEWKKANGIDPALKEKFFASISPEDKKKVEEERETFNRELKYDLDAAVQQAFPQSQTTAAKRQRNMV